MKRLNAIVCGCLICGYTGAQPAFNLIPKPVQTTPSGGQFELSPSTIIRCDKATERSALFLQEKLNRSTGMKLPVVASSPQENVIRLLIDTAQRLPSEGYTLKVISNEVSISGKDADGLFWGIQTLLQLLPPQIYSNNVEKNSSWRIPCVAIIDYPRFHYRGMMLDVSRQFFDVPTLKQFLDWLSFHKMNRFHWHLTDDQGWRIEIKKYPKLTSVGAWRGPGEALHPTYGSGDKRYGGFYTQAQVKEIVRYAAERHIEVIPEIELPGHSRAVAAAYPEILCPTDSVDMSQSAQGETHNVWCVGNEKNYAMINAILKEIAALFPSKIIHIGGDEVNMSVWQHCPVCSKLMKEKGMKTPEELQNYFVRRIEPMVNRLGDRMAGWDEIINGGGLASSTIVYNWHSLKKGEEITRQGQPVVMMNAQNYYFDMKQSDKERGHNWAAIIPLERVYALDPADATVFSEKEISFIQGVQGGVWAELFNEPPRFLEYQTFPRVCALAEAGWTPQAERNWDDFNNRLINTHYERLYYMGIAFRVPFPAPLYKNKTITVTPPYEGAVIRYTSDGSEPTVSSTLYSSPIHATDYANYTFKTFFNELSSISVTPECDAAGIWKTDTNSKPVEQSWDISPVCDRAGIWYVTFPADKQGKSPASISNVRLYENGIAVAADDRMSTTDKPVRYRLQALAFDAAKKYMLKALIQGKDTLSGTVRMERTPYLEPATGISVDMKISNNNASALTDYDANTFVRTKARGNAGESLTFVFDSPVACSRITAPTGHPLTAFYPLRWGHVEISYNGKTFERCAEFVKGKATVVPSKPVKAVKLIIDAPNDEPMVIFQDLKIEP